MIDLIDTATGVWFAAGLSAGLVHATTLWRAARRLTVWTPTLTILRLAVVAAVLTVAALWGEIIAAAVGWAVGFAVLAAWLALRRSNDRPCKIPPPSR